MMMPKIRVLHIITRLVNGGADENTLATVIGLMSHGYEIDVVVGGDSDMDLVRRMSSEVRFIVIPQLRRDIRASNFVALWKLFRLILKNRYYIVHTHTAMAGFLGRLASKLAFTPLVIHTLHGITFHNHLSRAARNLYIYLEVLASRCTDYFISVGDDIKERYLAIPIGSRDKYQTIRSGFDYKKFDDARLRSSEIQRAFRTEFGLGQDDVIVGMVSRIEPRKGHRYLLDAARRVLAVDPRCKFVIVGEGHFRDEYSRQVKAAGCSKNFIFTGHREDIEQIMAAFDIFVLTSLWEGLPRVLVQAALLAKPVLTFEVEGAREVIKENVNGFIIPPKDTASLAEKILVMVGNLHVAQEMGRSGLQFVSNRWDKRVMVDETADVYSRLIAKNRRAPGSVK